MYKQLSSFNKKTDALYQLEVNLSKKADTMDRTGQIMKQVCKGPPGESHCTVDGPVWTKRHVVGFRCSSRVCDSVYREMQTCMS